MTSRKSTHESENLARLCHAIVDEESDLSSAANYHINPSLLPLKKRRRLYDHRNEEEEEVDDDHNQKVMQSNVFSDTTTAASKRGRLDGVSLPIHPKSLSY
ncbi:hypothetical protein L484_000686 [Morus notabilis]|uniref:Uncharacterized protein n=1 Tax=Morus notabilis TaxID=981085 RepID=W9SQ04_9ROSA|nr:hypothetical protein L484_000686 [Morus notabilis]